MKIIKEVSKEEFKAFLFEGLDTNDSNIYKEMNADPVGIFQLSASTALKFSKQIKPQNLDELNAVNSLSRPGSSFGLPFYIDGKDKGDKLYPDVVHELLHETNGVILFQEQIMNIFVEIGGFTPEESNEIRSLMKKLGKAQKDQKDIDKWANQVKRFTENAKTKGLNKKEAENLAEDMVKFSGYSFNKSHAISYTLIACITLYLSFYFRKYYYSALLSYNLTKEEDDISLTVNAIKSNGINLLPPNINKSKEHLSVDGNDIVFGIADIKTVSDKPYSKIIETRPYTSFFDFLIRSKSRELSSTVIEALISVGAFDDFTKERVKLLFAFKKYWEEKKQIKVEERLKVIWEKCWMMANSIPGMETSNEKMMELERKYYGINIFTSSFDPEIMKAIGKMKTVGLINVSFNEVSEQAKKTPVVIKSVRTLIDKNGKEMAFVEIEDCIGNKIKIPIFQSFWQYIKEFFIVDSIYLLNLFKNQDEQIMFGSEKFTKDEIKILSFIKKLKLNT